MSRDWRLYADDIVASGEKIARLVEDHTFETWQGDEAAFDAVLLNLLVIGEAAKNVPQEIQTLEPQAAWKNAARMRDIVAHHYFGLDLHIVWDVATVHIPVLLAAARPFWHPDRTPNGQCPPPSLTAPCSSFWPPCFCSPGRCSGC